MTNPHGSNPKKTRKQTLAELDQNLEQEAQKAGPNNLNIIDNDNDVDGDSQTLASPPPKMSPKEMAKEIARL